MPDFQQQPRATAKEVDRRVTAVEGLLANRIRKGEIKKLIKKKFGVGYREVEEYIARAKKRLLDRSGQPPEEHRATALAFYENVIRSNAKMCDKIAAQDRIIALLGIQVRPGDNDEKKSPPICIEVVVGDRTEARQFMSFADYRKQLPAPPVIDVRQAGNMASDVAGDVIDAAPQPGGESLPTSNNGHAAELPPNCEEIVVESPAAAPCGESLPKAADPFACLSNSNGHANGKPSSNGHAAKKKQDPPAAEQPQPQPPPTEPAPPPDQSWLTDL